jgi:hypothetical protein
MSRTDVLRLSGLVGAAFLLASPMAVAGQTAETGRTGRQVYESICITCHGPDGRGGVNQAIEKIVKLPDFSDCGFANREPDRGFLAVAHNGGPARGFSPIMAPWGGAFSEHELALAVSHIRTLCTDQRWPRGELNLPRPLVTAKASHRPNNVHGMARSMRLEVKGGAMAALELSAHLTVRPG